MDAPGGGNATQEGNATATESGAASSATAEDAALRVGTVATSAAAMGVAVAFVVMLL